jgi:hypothetical protein
LIDDARAAEMVLLPVQDTTTPPAQSEFLPRVLRCLAAVCFAYGLIGTLDMTVRFATYGLRYPSYGPSYYTVQRGIEIFSGGLSVLLLVAAIALWRWKSWSRVTLIVWAALWIVMGIVSNAFWRISFLQQRRTTTQPQFLPSPLYYTWLTMSSMVQRAAFPAIVLCILLQPQVSKLWAQVTGGFEVVPFARTTQQQTDLQ